MAAMVEVRIGPQFAHWVRGFAVLVPEMVAGPGSILWTQAAEMMYSRSQEYVHVSGEKHDDDYAVNLKASIQPPKITKTPASIEAAVAYLQSYAEYEFAREGTHDALGQAYVATAGDFQDALGRMYEITVGTWR